MPAYKNHSRFSLCNLLTALLLAAAIPLELFTGCQYETDPDDTEAIRETISNDTVTIHEVVSDDIDQYGFEIGIALFSIIVYDDMGEGSKVCAVDRIRS